MKRSSTRLVYCLVLSGMTGLLAAQEVKPHTYGTSAISYVRVPGVALFPDHYASEYDTGGGGRRFANGSMSAPIQLPDGARIVSLDFDFYDGDAAQPIFASLAVCGRFGDVACDPHPAAGAGPADCLLPGYICSGAAFAGGSSSQGADLSPDAITVDNVDHAYVIRAASAAIDGSRQFAGLLVGYVLQVSPPPGTATFNDVPTSHPFFQYVEALSKSGITAGCGGGKFCPDSPLTRGQMAVFLSKALGLQFP